MTAQREHLITELCKQFGWDHENADRRSEMDKYITETHAKEARMSERADKVVAVYQRGLLTVSDLHQRLGEILEERG